MPEELRVQRFSAALLGEVRDFYCGDEPWDVEVSQWIKESAIDDCALNWMERGTAVWLYRTPGGAIVGYGSLGTTKWKWPPPDGARESVSIIPSFGVQIAYQGEPKGAPAEERYSYRIMADLIAKAGQQHARLLGLFVDRRNARAKAFYQRVGFQFLPDVGGPYERMFLVLAPQPSR